MVLKIAGYFGLAALIAVLVQTMLTTYEIGKIDAGLRQSVDSTSRLLTIQQAIIQKNEALQDVVKTTQAMDTGLSQALTSTQGVRAHIQKINELNSATLVLNRQMVSLGSAGTQSLAGIQTNMGQVQYSTQALFDALTGLKGSVAQDRQYMAQMKDYTSQMNNKVPSALGSLPGGVLPNLPGGVLPPLPGVPK